MATCSTVWLGRDLPATTRMYVYIRQLMALAFLAAQHIRQTFDHLKTKANTEQLQRLVNFMDRQWFQHAVFDVASWCVFRQTVRTNNDVESNYSRLPSSRRPRASLKYFEICELRLIRFAEMRKNDRILQISQMNK